MPKNNIVEFLDQIDIESTLMEESKESFVDRFDTLQETTRTKALELGKVIGKSEQEVNEVVDQYFKNLYAPKIDERKVPIKLAKLYIDRKRIGMQYGIPAAIGAGVIGIITGVGILTNSTIQSAKERGVERSVQESYNNRAELNSKIQTLESSLSALDEQDSKEIKWIVYSSRNNLSSTDSFFTDYCSDGTSADDVTKENYKDVENKLQPVLSVIDNADKDIQKGNDVVTRHETIVSAKSSLETIMQEISSHSPPGILLERARASYDSGIASVKNKQANQAVQYENQLRAIKADVQDYFTIPKDIERTHSSVKTKAKDPEAIQLEDHLYVEAQSYIKNADVNNLREISKRIQNIEVVLDQQYIIQIVNKSGVKSGIDRYYTDSSGKRISGCYLIVEAGDKNGDLGPKRGKNEEDGRTSTVTMWGERVPDYVYDSVKNDKIDNGIIEDNIFGVKQQGYLNDEVTFRVNNTPITRAGQITQW